MSDKVEILARELAVQLSPLLTQAGASDYWDELSSSHQNYLRNGVMAVLALANSGLVRTSRTASHHITWGEAIGRAAAAAPTDAHMFLFVIAEAWRRVFRKVSLPPS